MSRLPTSFVAQRNDQRGECHPQLAGQDVDCGLSERGGA
jgi:hypothetical protein